MTNKAFLETLQRLIDQAAKAQIAANDDRTEFIARGEEQAYRKMYQLLNPAERLAEMREEVKAHGDC